LTTATKRRFIQTIDTKIRFIFVIPKDMKTKVTQIPCYYCRCYCYHYYYFIIIITVD